MGSSTAPKTFQSATPFGQSPASPITTETQPLAQNTGPQTPAMSGYNLQMQTPITSPMAQQGDGLGGAQDAMAQFKTRRNGGGIMPFYGAMQ